MKRREVTSQEFEEAYANLDNVRVMRTVTNKYSKILSVDDLKSCALQGLWRCLAYHDDTKQKFTTSLWRFTNWECRRELAKMRYKKNSMYTQSLSNMDVEYKPNPAIQDMMECMELLPDTDKNIIQQYYFERRTMEEIGQINRYSKEAARTKIKKAVKKLREIYCEGVSY